MVIDSSGEMTNICNGIMLHVEMVIFTVIDNSGEMTNITNVTMPHVEMVIFTVIDSSGEMTNISNVIMPHVEMVIFTVIDNSSEITNISNVIMPHVEMVIFTVIDSSGETINISNASIPHVEMVNPDLVTIRYILLFLFVERWKHFCVLFLFHFLYIASLLYFQYKSTVPETFLKNNSNSNTKAYQKEHKQNEMETRPCRDKLSNKTFYSDTQELTNQNSAIS